MCPIAGTAAMRAITIPRRARTHLLEWVERGAETTEITPNSGSSAEHAFQPGRDGFGWEPDLSRGQGGDTGGPT